jgi:hypothetical protein
VAVRKNDMGWVQIGSPDPGLLRRWIAGDKGIYQNVNTAIGYPPGRMAQKGKRKVFCHARTGIKMIEREPTIRRAEDTPEAAGYAIREVSSLQNSEKQEADGGGSVRIDPC